MLKLLGAIIIVLASGIWGISKSEKLKKRSDGLLKVISAMHLLENEISYSQKEIAKALMSVSIMENLPLFADISEKLGRLDAPKAFSDALDVSDMNFSKSDKNILIEFSQNLGTLSKDFQLESLLKTSELLSNAQLSAYEEYKKYGKLYKNMGFLLGILTAILLF